MNFLQRLEQELAQKRLPKSLVETLRHFYDTYLKTLSQNKGDITTVTPILNQFLDLVIKQLKTPFTFEPFHQRITEPFDYYRFGLDFISPMILKDESTVSGLENFDTIQGYLKKGENVILFANHQTEPDPQAMSLLLKKTHPKLAEEMIFVAGHRVTTDPLAVPFSMGVNLLCIYSKKHMEHPPEEKVAKLRHNRLTMKTMSELLAKGGKCIYVAPSGGRDRPDATGHVSVAPFDPQSIEMFRLMAKKSDHPTHFFPLALATFALLPPPNSVKKTIGEARVAQCTPIHMACGQEIDTENYPGCEHPDKKERRSLLAEYIWKLVCADYAKLEKNF